MILLFPFAAKTTEGKPSPKDYPHFDVVVRRLSEQGLEVHQVSRSSEPQIPGCSRSKDLNLKEISGYLQECETWVSCDSFAQHLAWTIHESGVVIFGASDPLIFGHPENINLLKSRKFLREWQFRFWSQVKAYPEMWVGPEAVVNAVLLSVAQRKRHKTERRATGASPV